MIKGIVVSGATSMLGLALIQLAAEQGIHVLALVNPNSSRKDRIPNNSQIKTLECDISEIKTKIEDFCKNGWTCHFSSEERSDEKYDIFYHLAWGATSHDGRNDVRKHLDNIAYTIDAVEAAHLLGCHRFIGAGSQAEYGRHNTALTPNTLCNPEVPYGSAKLCAGDMSRIRCRQLGMEHIWTRTLSAYGPYDSENTIIPLTIKALLKGEHFSSSQGTQIWEFIYSEDVARALLLLGEKGIDGKVYPIGSGDARPLKEFLEIIKNKINPNTQIGYGEISFSPMQIMHLEADISDLKKDTGYEPQVSFEDGIDRTIEYFRNR